MDPSDRSNLLRHAIGFESLEDPQICQLKKIFHVHKFQKGHTVFEEYSICRHFYLVASGLIRVSLVSQSGNRITYLLAGPGEPLNLVGPFSSLPRPLRAEAMEDAEVLQADRKDFSAFCQENPVVLENIIVILGRAVDSANTRVLDMMEMRVEERLLKVLRTLCSKFGSRLDFTSTELAQMAGTTTESALRVMARLRQRGIILTRRGQIQIVKAEHLEHAGDENMWI